jgi:PHD/YefM family antitoxin component YafN of YafNO toxin-antitoxin module
MSIHPQIIEKEGRKEFVVLPYEEFVLMQEALEDYEDLRALRDEKATAHGEPTRSLDDILNELRD